MNQRASNEQWKFSEREEAAKEAWSKWSLPGEPMPIEFRAGVHMGIAMAQRQLLKNVTRAPSHTIGDRDA